MMRPLSRRLITSMSMTPRDESIHLIKKKTGATSEAFVSAPVLINHKNNYWALHIVE